MMKIKILWLAAAILTLYACSNNKPGADLVNKKASFPLSFDFARLKLKVVTSSINKKQGTMATLYGNNKALRAAKAGGQARTEGEVFALVTWKQQDDPGWFGAKIPGDLQTVEFIRVMPPVNGINKIVYGRLKGKNLSPDADTTHRQERIKYIFDQKPSVMP